MVTRPRHYPHTGVDDVCRFGCGHPVTIFTDDATGQLVQLQPAAPPPTVDTTGPGYCHRLWEFRGVHLGWVACFRGERSWRPCRLEHDCAATPKTHRPRRHTQPRRT